MEAAQAGALTYANKARETFDQYVRENWKTPAQLQDIADLIGPFWVCVEESVDCVSAEIFEYKQDEALIGRQSCFTVHGPLDTLAGAMLCVLSLPIVTGKPLIHLARGCEARKTPVRIFDRHRKQSCEWVMPGLFWTSRQESPNLWIMRKVEDWGEG